MKPEEEKNNELATLEETETSVSETATTERLEPAVEPGSEPTPPAEPKLPRRPTITSARVRGFLNHFNIYLMVFLALTLIAIAAIIAGVRWNSSQENDGVEVTPLSAEELASLRGTDARVGDPKQTLSIESNTIFSGQVLVRDNLDVAGTIRVGGSLDLPGITVSGNSSFDQIQANDLNITGNTTLQGQLNVEQSLAVSGNGSFGGALSAPQINVQNLQLSGDLQISRHIEAGGGTPSRSNGSALGSGGTSSVSGTDTAGTVTINTGNSPSAGCYITVRFAQSFNGTPHVVITPVNSAGASLNYYINRNTSGFSVCAINTPAGGTTFSFDYIAID